MFQTMIQDWFVKAEEDYNDFVKALLSDDVDAMNAYMNRVALQPFSYFDTGKKVSGEEPERFYHGFQSAQSEKGNRTGASGRECDRADQGKKL